jgi:hypothetical protein
LSSSLLLLLLLETQLNTPLTLKCTKTRGKSHVFRVEIQIVLRESSTPGAAVPRPAAAKEHVVQARRKVPAQPKKPHVDVLQRALRVLYIDPDEVNGDRARTL